MGVNLQKGQKVDLTKGNAGLSRIMVGLGWDPVIQSKGGGILGGLFGGGKSEEYDLDASVFLLDENDKIMSNKDIIYFGNLKSQCGSIQHTGDNLTGSGDGDDEQIIVELNQVPERISKIVFVVNIYDCIKRKQDFGQIENAFIRIVDHNGTEIIKYNLTDNYSGKTALVTGEIYRHDGEWKFAAIGEGTNDMSITDMSKRYKN